MKVKRVLGEGSYGSVVHVEKRGEDFAMKTVMGDEIGLVSLQEVDIMNSVSNPFVVSARKTYIEGNAVLIFMDLADATLHHFKIESEDQFRMIAYQMICAMAYLEKKKIIHGDIKGNNFLCYKDTYGLPLNIRVTDFSLSCRSYGQSSKPMFKMFCAIYRAAEVWFSEAETKSDIWALGCCLYELFTKNDFLVPVQDETKDNKPFDLLEVSRSGRTKKHHSRWKKSYDMYLSCLLSIAETMKQPLSESMKQRLQAARGRCDEVGSQIRVRNWTSALESLPPYVRDMLTVDPSYRPSATELMNSPYFYHERATITSALQNHYQSNNIECSFGTAVILDGMVKHHSKRIPLSFAEIAYFLENRRSHRIPRLVAIDVLSKCRHYQPEGYARNFLMACLLIGCKLTDPSQMDWLGDEDIEGIIQMEQVICQALNYVIYPEDHVIFDFTDDQVYAFYS